MNGLPQAGVERVAFDDPNICRDSVSMAAREARWTGGRPLFGQGQHGSNARGLNRCQC